jgi:hypothetical protein
VSLGGPAGGEDTIITMAIEDPKRLYSRLKLTFKACLEDTLAFIL